MEKWEIKCLAKKNSLLKYVKKMQSIMHPITFDTTTINGCRDYLGKKTPFKNSFQHT
jgi:hypothetical protein